MNHLRVARSLWAALLAAALLAAAQCSADGVGERFGRTLSQGTGPLGDEDWGPVSSLLSRRRTHRDDFSLHSTVCCPLPPLRARPALRPLLPLSTFVRRIRPCARPARGMCGANRMPDTQFALPVPRRAGLCLGEPGRQQGPPARGHDVRRRQVHRAGAVLGPRAVPRNQAGVQWY